MYTEVESRKINVVKILILLSILAFFLLVLGASFISAKASARDEIRSSDIKLILSFLSDYKRSFGAYPINNSKNLPVGWENFLEYLPPSILPPDGACTEGTNQYDYISVNHGTTYQLSFCLGHKTKNFPAGINVIKPS